MLSPNLMHLSILLSAIALKNKGEMMSYVLVVWCQLLKWEKHFVFALKGMPKLAASVHADERACALPFLSITGPVSFVALATFLIVSQPALMGAGPPGSRRGSIYTCMALNTVFPRIVSAETILF